MMSKGKTVETSNKHVQTRIHCFPHILSTESSDSVKVFSDIGCQTTASTAPETSDLKFYAFLKFTPYQAIAADSIKELDLPRRALLHWSSSVYDKKGELSFPARTSDRESDTLFSKKGVLKKSNSELTRPASLTRLQATHHQTMQKSLTESEVQTTITVSPHVLDTDEVANVFTELSIQTSITCLPKESISNILPQLKANLSHYSGSATSVATRSVFSESSPTYEKQMPVSEWGNEQTKPAEEFLNEPSQIAEKDVELAKRGLLSPETHHLQDKTRSSCTCGERALGRIAGQLRVQASTLKLTPHVFPPGAKFEDRIIQVINTTMAVLQTEMAKMFELYTKESDTICGCTGSSVYTITKDSKVCKCGDQSYLCKTISSKISNYSKTTPGEEEFKNDYDLTAVSEYAENERIVKDIRLDDDDVFLSVPTGQPEKETTGNKEKRSNEITDRPLSSSLREELIAEYEEISLIRHLSEPDTTRSFTMGEEHQERPPSIINDDVIDEPVQDIAPVNVSYEVIRDLPENISEHSIQENAPVNVSYEVIGDLLENIPEHSIEDIAPVNVAYEVIGDLPENISEHSIPCECHPTEAGAAPPNITASVPVTEPPTSNEYSGHATDVRTSQTTQTQPYSESLESCVCPDNPESTTDVADATSVTNEEISMVTDDAPSLMEDSSSPEKAMIFEIILKKNVKDVESISATSAIVVRANLSCPNTSAVSKNVHARSSLPDLREQVIRLSVIYKNGSETRIEETLTPAHPVTIASHKSHSSHVEKVSYPYSSSFHGDDICECGGLDYATESPGRESSNGIDASSSTVNNSSRKINLQQKPEQDEVVSKLPRYITSTMTTCPKKKTICLCDSCRHLAESTTQASNSRTTTATTPYPCSCQTRQSAHLNNYEINISVNLGDGKDDDQQDEGKSPSFMYEHDTSYDEPYMDELVEFRDASTAVQTDIMLGDKLESESLNSIDLDETWSSTCDSKTEMPWQKISLPPPGTYSIKPIDTKTNPQDSREARKTGKLESSQTGTSKLESAQTSTRTIDADGINAADAAFLERGKYVKNSENVVNTETGEDVKNTENVTNIETGEDVKNTEDAANIKTGEDVKNAEDVANTEIGEDVNNTEDVANTETGEDVNNAEDDVANTETGEDVNAEDVANTETGEDVNNAEDDVANTETGEDVKHSEDVANTETREDVNNAEDIANTVNVENAERVEDTENEANIEPDDEEEEQGAISLTSTTKSIEEASGTKSIEEPSRTKSIEEPSSTKSIEEPSSKPTEKRSGESTHEASGEPIESGIGASAAPIRKRKEQLLFESERFKQNEPYMEGLYRSYPDSDEDDKCGSNTEMPWKDILVPKNCKIKTVQKKKKCECKTAPEVKSGMYISVSKSFKNLEDNDERVIQIYVGFEEPPSGIITVERGASSQQTLQTTSVFSGTIQQPKRVPKRCTLEVDLIKPSNVSVSFQGDANLQKAATSMSTVEKSSRIFSVSSRILDNRISTTISIKHSAGCVIGSDKYAPQAFTGNAPVQITSCSSMKDAKDPGIPSSIMKSTSSMPEVCSKNSVNATKKLSFCGEEKLTTVQALDEHTSQMSHPESNVAELSSTLAAESSSASKCSSVPQGSVTPVAPQDTSVLPGSSVLPDASVIPDASVLPDASAPPCQCLSNVKSGISRLKNKQDPVIAALEAYEAEMKPLMRAVTELQQKIRNLNVAEINDCGCTRPCTWPTTPGAQGSGAYSTTFVQSKVFVQGELGKATRCTARFKPRISPLNQYPQICRPIAQPLFGPSSSYVYNSSLPSPMLPSYQPYSQPSTSVYTPSNLPDLQTCSCSCRRSRVCIKEPTPTRDSALQTKSYGAFPNCNRCKKYKDERRKGNSVSERFKSQKITTAHSSDNVTSDNSEASDICPCVLARHKSSRQGHKHKHSNSNCKHKNGSVPDKPDKPSKNDGSTHCKDYYDSYLRPGQAVKTSPEEFFTYSSHTRKKTNMQDIQSSKPKCKYRSYR